MQKLFENWREFTGAPITEAAGDRATQLPSAPARPPLREPTERAPQRSEPIARPNTSQRQDLEWWRSISGPEQTEIDRAVKWRNAQEAKYGKNLKGAPDWVLKDPRGVSPGELPYGQPLPWANDRPFIKRRPGKPQKPATGAPSTPLSSRSPSGRVVDYPAPHIDPLTGKAVPPPGFKEPYPVRKTPGMTSKALAAFGVAELSVHAVDSLGGDLLRRGLAKLIGADPEYIKSIPILTLKQRLKKLASPVTGLIDLGKVGASELSLALGVRNPSEQEARKAAYAKRIGDSEAAARAAARSGYKVNPKGFIPGQRAGATIANPINPIREDKVRGKIEKTSCGNNTRIRIKIGL
jgi:hypothetical protein